MSGNKPIVSSTNVSKSYENFVVFKGVDFSIQQGEKVGLVGSNGSGKSTLLKIIKGSVVCDDGSVTVSKGINIGYIPQEFGGSSDCLVENFLNEKQNNPFEQQELFSVLRKLKLEESILKRKIGTLSGGEKTKVALMKIFLSDADFLLLDEPTNNLDMYSLELLEKYVTSSKKTFLIVSHDRQFLNRTVQRIFEIDEVDKKLRIYDGNFSAYLQTRHVRIEKVWAVYQDNVEKKECLKKASEEKLKRADEISHSKARDADIMQRNFKVERGQKAFHRGAVLLKERLENVETVEKPKEFLPLCINFEIGKRSGDKVFELMSVTKKLPEYLIGPVNMRVQYGDKILISGVNGSGKTTLLKMILKEISPDSGEVRWGTNVKIGYLPQEESFVSEAKVKDEFVRHTDIEEGLARRVLHRFKLSSEDVEKRIKDLSSGERSRLVIATVMAKKVNCLVLDEPSNHLDLQALESLEYAVKNFQGTLIVVSHDRYFINQIKPLKSFVLEDGKVYDRGSIV